MTSIEDRYIALLLRDAVYSRQYVFNPDAIEVPAAVDAMKDFDVMKSILKTYQDLRTANDQVKAYDATGETPYAAQSGEKLKELQKKLQDQMDAVTITHKKFVEVVEHYYRTLRVADLKTEVQRWRDKLRRQEEALTSTIESIPKKKARLENMIHQKRRKYDEYVSECEKLGCLPVPEEKLAPEPHPLSPPLPAVIVSTENN
jgi:hypothetical protein